MLQMGNSLYQLYDGPAFSRPIIVISSTVPILAAILIEEKNRLERDRMTPDGIKILLKITLCSNFVQQMITSKRVSGKFRTSCYS